MNLPKEKFARRNLLIAVKSCQRDLSLGCHNHARKWAAELKLDADLKCFVGGDQEILTADDEVWLPGVPDDYQSLPLKTRAICRYMLAHHYRHVFLCDNDTSVYVGGFRHFYYLHEDADVMGEFEGRTKEVPAQTAAGHHQPAQPAVCYPSGGGYFLSRKAAKIVADFDGGHKTAEDRMVGDAIRIHDLVLAPFDIPIWYAAGGRGTVHPPIPWPMPPADHIERQGTTAPRLFETTRPTRKGFLWES